MRSSGKYWWLAVLVWLCPTSSPGQTIRLSAPTGKTGDWVIIEVQYQPSSWRELVALQWEAEIPSGQLELQSGKMIRPLLVASDAGKSLSCTVERESSSVQLLRCILAGGQKPIPGGTLALLSLKIPEAAPPGTARVQFKSVAGVSRDLKQIQITPAETLVTIQRR